MDHQPFHLKLSDKELFKELLFILKARGDIDAISTSTLKEFGDIQTILRQSQNDLQKIKGLTPTLIKRIKIIYSLFREIIKPDAYVAKAPKKFEDFLYFMLTAPRFDGQSLRLLYLDEDYVILKDFIYKKGSGNQVKFYFREIVKEILNTSVSNIVFIHHKTNASARPSLEDQEKYKEFCVAFKNLDINLVDYLIINENSVFSFHYNQLFLSAVS